MDVTREQVLEMLYHHPVQIGKWVGFNDLTELHNQWLRDFLYGEQDQTKQAHRGSYKTTTLSLFFAIHSVIFPNETVMYFRKTATDVVEIAGQGITARVGDRKVSVGNTKLMDAVGARWHDCPRCGNHHAAVVGTIIHVAIDGQYAGHIIINDQLKSDSTAAIGQLKALGVRKTVMLTGDRQEVAEHVAKQLGIDEYHAELLPAEKVKFFEETSTCHSQLPARQAAKAFVGDGINDAPVLARADVGIAMGGLGSDAAIEAADVVLMTDEPLKIAQAVRIARRTLSIARQNVWFAIGVKVAVLILATFGLATMWLAVFADVGVTVLAVVSAMRALRA